jgi:putative phosphoribosyl transferase
MPAPPTNAPAAAAPTSNQDRIRVGWVESIVVSFGFVSAARDRARDHRAIGGAEGPGKEVRVVEEPRLPSGRERAQGRRVRFSDRRDAGRQLAALLTGTGPDPVVLALPRGGVPVGFEIAASLPAPLDVIVVRKLGVPAQPELAMGAIGEGDVRVLNADVVRHARIGADDLQRVERTERIELDRRLDRYRRGRPPVPIANRTAVIVDDGIATGATARAACQVARAQGARRIVLAAPVAPPSTIRALRDVADDVVVVEAPERFFAIGEFYRDFTPTTDAEVVELLAAADHG